MHIFRYSPRKGTKAAAMKDQVPAPLSVQRSQALQDLADRLAYEFHTSQLGRPQQVLVETHTGSGAAEGYTAAYIPVRIEPGQELAPGQVYEVIPVSADNQFLYCNGCKAPADHVKIEKNPARVI